MPPLRLTRAHFKSQTELLCIKICLVTKKGSIKLWHTEAIWQTIEQPTKRKACFYGEPCDSDPAGVL
jgi:hypothetical protein